MKKILISLLIASSCLTACAPVISTPSITSTPIPTQLPSSTSTPVTAQSSTVLRPFPQHTVYASGSILPNHRTQAQLDQDVRDFYDYWKATYVIDAGTDEAGSPLYRIAFAKDGEDHESTVSEGQGFGMIILPVMAGADPDAQEIFDGLWRFSRSHPSTIDSRLMDWKVPDTESGNDSAFDGDTDMALGLLMADAQWGSQGKIDYKADAMNLLAGIQESTIGPESALPMLGDWTDPAGEDYNQYTPRSSDFMLVDFHTFARATNNDLWNTVATNSQNVMLSIQQTYSPNTGLMPDFIVSTGENHTPQPAPADFLEGSNDGNYGYNAGRVPWRVGADALLYDDSTSKEIALKISHWAESVSGGDPTAFKAGYTLDGNPSEGSDYFSTFFVAPLGVAAMSDPAQQQWLNKIYDAVYNTHDNYYEDSVTLLCLITMSGNAWVP